MPRNLILFGILVTFLPLGCRENATNGHTDHQSGSSALKIVEAGCGSCMFGMPDVAGCPLAVRIDGQAYLVKGSDIDDHGDAHADDGLCNAVRQAEVAGSVVDGQFVAASFRLLPAAE